MGSFDNLLMDHVRFQEIQRLCDELRTSHYCLSLMFSYFTLSWEPLKRELASQDHSIDDLAAPSTWVVSTELFSLIVGLGFETLFLDILRFLPVDQLVLLTELLQHNPVLSLSFLDHFEHPGTCGNIFGFETPWIILSHAISRWVEVTEDCTSITSSFSTDALVSCLTFLVQFAVLLSRGILSGTDQIPWPHSAFNAMCREGEPGPGDIQVSTFWQCV